MSTPEVALDYVKDALKRLERAERDVTEARSALTMAHYHLTYDDSHDH